MADESWLDPRIEVATSTIEGRGLFAREPVAVGDIIIRLRGEELTSEQLVARIAGLPRYSALAIDDDLQLLIADDSPTNFGNHSCDANLWMVDAVTLAARRPIMAGEEVTVDYATHSADVPWSMPCNCGSPDCRGVVTHLDWQRPDVQARYAGHFSPFLNRRIAARGR